MNDADVVASWFVILLAVLGFLFLFIGLRNWWRDRFTGPDMLAPWRERR